MTAWTKIALALLVAAVLGIVAGTIWIGASVREETVVAHPYEEGVLHHSEHAGSAPCDLADGACTGSLDGGGEVTLELSPRPLRTMRELAVRATVREPTRSEPRATSAPQLQRVSVSFSMTGMEMGENRVALGRGAFDAYDGRAVLVRCPSGKRAWIADVSVARAGAAPGTARFTFTVKD